MYMFIYVDAYLIYMCTPSYFVLCLELSRRESRSEINFYASSCLGGNLEEKSLKETAINHKNAAAQIDAPTKWEIAKRNQ